MTERSRTREAPATAARQLHEHVRLRARRFRVHATFAGRRPAGPIIAVLGGFLAGVAFVALLALIMGRLDSRVRRPDDIEVVGVPVVDIDSAGRPRLGAAAALRAGAGRHGHPPGRDRGHAADPPRGLERPGAGAGPHVRRRGHRHDPGQRRPARAHGARPRRACPACSTAAATPPLVELDENLSWLPEGTSDALARDAVLGAAGRAHRPRPARRQAGVVVIDAPAVLEDSETLPLIACSDIVLLTVRPGAPRWNPLGSAVVADPARRQAAAAHLLRPRAGQAARCRRRASCKPEPAERVHQVIEVPAGS